MKKVVDRIKVTTRRNITINVVSADGWQTGFGVVEELNQWPRKSSMCVSAFGTDIPPLSRGQLSEQQLVVIVKLFLCWLSQHFHLYTLLDIKLLLRTNPPSITKIVSSFNTDVGFTQLPPL